MEYEQPDAVTRGSPARGTRWVQLPRAAHIHEERTLACPSGTRRKAASSTYYYVSITTNYYNITYSLLQFTTLSLHNDYFNLNLC